MLLFVTDNNCAVVVVVVVVDYCEIVPGRSLAVNDRATVHGTRARLAGSGATLPGRVVLSQHSPAQTTGIPRYHSPGRPQPWTNIQL